MSIHVTYIGHATVHLQSDKLSLYTDPVFSNRLWFLKRHSPLTILPSERPEPTAMLISHAHYDHLDIYSFKYFPSKIPVIVPIGLGRLVSRFINNPIIELAHHASHQIKEGLEVTAFPVAHAGFRLSGLTYRTCNGYLITLNGTKIFFPGDTGWRDDFANYRGVDVALLPLGPTKPDWFMHPRHLTATEVIRLSDLLQAKLAVPIHWGTFRLSFEGVRDNIEELQSLLSKKTDAAPFKILNPGESTTSL